MQTLLQGGCPCTDTACPRRGYCNQCIRHHVQKGTSLVSCMRPVAEQIFRQEEKARP